MGIGKKRVLTKTNAIKLYMPLELMVSNVRCFYKTYILYCDFLWAFPIPFILHLHLLWRTHKCLKFVGHPLMEHHQFQIFYFMITSFRARTSSYLFWSGYCYPMKLLFTPEATCPYNLLSNSQIMHMDSKSGPHDTSCAASNKHTYLALRVGNSEYLS